MPMTTRPTSFSSTGRAVVHRQHHIADVLERVEPAQAAHVIELAALRIETAAGVAVVGGERALHLRHRQADAGDLRRIEQHLVLHGAAAEAGIVRHAGHGADIAARRSSPRRS